MRHPVSVPGPHLLAAALCAGLALAVALRCPGAPLALVAMAFALLALASGTHRAGLLALALLAAGWWWGSVRLEAIDRSELASEIGGSAVFAPR